MPVPDAEPSPALPEPASPAAVPDDGVPTPAAAAPVADVDALSPAAAEPDAGPARDELFERARTAFLAPEQRLSRSLLFMTSLALFVLFSLGGSSGLAELVVLVAVLLFHELGHLAGMKLFDYRDLKVFFIPLVGAAASGRKLDAPAWQQAIVSLLGPLPGIFVGLGLAISYAFAPVDQIEKVAVMALLLNGFNLLPLFPLDGGRLMQTVLFSRHRVAETLFLALAAAALGGLALWSQSWVLGVVALFGAMSLPAQARRAKAVAQLRSSGLTLPADPATIDEARLRALFAEARGALPEPRSDARQIAEAMKAIHERLLTTPPGAWATVALLAAWCLGLASTVAGAVILAFARTLRS